MKMEENDYLVSFLHYAQLLVQIIFCQEEVKMAEPAKEEKKETPETKGWLYKWTNYIKVLFKTVLHTECVAQGYQKRWFVLQNGLLSYYRNQAEMAHTCRCKIFSLL